MVSRIREKLFSILEKHGRAGLEPFGSGTRVAVLVLMLAFVGLGVVGFSALVNPAQFTDPEGLDLSGKWKFYNGSLKNASMDVDVPKPLAPQLKEELAAEYFYKRKFTVPDSLLSSGEDLSITLGSIKGRYTIWVNGQYLASSTLELTLANHPLPRALLKNRDLEVIVKVVRAETLFPGIVHLVPMQLGRSQFLSHQTGHFFFQLAVKPIIPALFKGMMFLIFATLFFTMAIRREYFWFSFYALSSALGAFSYWQYSPFFENYYLRQKIIFAFYVASIACLPMLTVEFCRLGGAARRFAAFATGCLAIMPVLSLVWIDSSAGEQYLFQKVYAWAPLMVFPPCILLAFSSAWFLGNKMKLRHRMWQLSAFGIFLCVGFALQMNWGQYFLRYRSFNFAEIADVGVFVGLALSMVFDFKMTSVQWQRSQKSLPSLVARVASAGLRKAVVEFQAVVLVIDVVGYTKKLVTLRGLERDLYNSEIKRVSTAAVGECGGEKVSDTGDGAVFVWAYQNERERVVAESAALKAALLLGATSSGELQFRCGISLGSIKCHWDEPQFSYLGDPINTAARLQSVAPPGGVLVDEAISTSGEVVEHQIKGARFRARAVTNFKQVA